MEYVCLRCGLPANVDDPVELPRSNEYCSHEFELMEDVCRSNEELANRKYKYCGELVFEGGQWGVEGSAVICDSCLGSIPS